MGELLTNERTSKNSNGRWLADPSRSPPRTSEKDLIHRSAWKWNSRKFRCRILHGCPSERPAFWRFAITRFAFSRFALSKFALMRFTSVRNASPRSALQRSALLRYSPVRLGPRVYVLVLQVEVEMRVVDGVEP